MTLTGGIRLYSQGYQQRKHQERPQPPKKSRRAIRITIYTVLALAYLYISSALMIFDGPFTALRQYAVDSLSVTRHAYLLRPISLFTVSQAEIRQHSRGWIDSTGVPATTADKNYSSVHDNSIQVTTEPFPLYTANIMLIHNPNRVHVAVTSHMGVVGQTVEDMVKETHAVAGINGGAFNDTHWQGTGGIPMGTVVTSGKYVQVDAKSPLIGITKLGQLVCGFYTPSEMQSMGIRDALSFGPILVQNGRPVAPRDYGRNPRTAIGQKADGTIIFIVTDGRSLSHPGSTYIDIQNLMVKYGAVTAANLDGGSSTTMVYNGKLVNNPSDILGQRFVATSFVVMP